MYTRLNRGFGFRIAEFTEDTEHAEKMPASTFTAEDRHNLEECDTKIAQPNWLCYKREVAICLSLQAVRFLLHSIR